LTFIDKNTDKFVALRGREEEKFPGGLRIKTKIKVKGVILVPLRI